ncbi:hypothetical protein vseg_008683 [Gypsophila vaccaria]
MGNICNRGGHANNEQQPARKRPPYKRATSVPRTNSNSNSNNNTRWSRVRSSSSSLSRRDNVSIHDDDDRVIHEAALATILLQQQQQQNERSSLPPFDRSSSLRYQSSYKKHQQRSKEGSGLPRCSSSRPRSSTDPLLHPLCLFDQGTKPNDQPSCHFVLVHGGGFGAWCWYKTIALLEEGGFTVTAIDLAGSGIHSFDANEITSLSQYVKPLTELLEKLADDDKVILVGHDFGGVCISYAMELFPSKVSKAVFVAAIMLTDGQSALNIFSQQVDSKNLLQKAQVSLYANGNDHPPTAIDLDRTLVKELLFNQSPAKDIALASVSMRLVPFAPMLEKLTLSTDKYGCVRRFYIETSEDNTLPVTLQGQMTEASPPEQIFRLKGADHSPFFSKPQALHKHLIEIAKIL